MGLVNAADGEGLAGLSVHRAKGGLIFIIEGRSMLVDHDAIFLQGPIGIAIKFLGKEPFRMPKRIGSVIDDDVILIFTVAQETQPILQIDFNPLIFQARCVVREIFPTDFDQ